jgi:hypothetical protein
MTITPRDVLNQFKFTVFIIENFFMIYHIV